MASESHCNHPFRPTLLLVVLLALLLLHPSHAQLADDNVENVAEEVSAADRRKYLLNREAVLADPTPDDEPPTLQSSTGIDVAISINGVDVKVANALPAVPVADAVVGSAADYAYMYWKDGLRDSTRLTLAVQTSRYGLEWNYNTLKLLSFGALRQRYSEPYVLNLFNDMIEGSNLPGTPSLTFGLVVTGKTYTAVGTYGDFIQGAELIEHGRWYNRRRLDAISWSSGTPYIRSVIELGVWPDRVSWTLTVTNMNTLSGFERIFISLSAAGLGSDFTLAGSNGASLIGSNTISLSPPNWLTSDTYSVTLVTFFNPLERGLSDLTTPIVVTADQTVPVSAPGLGVTYEENEGWHRIDLRNDAQGVVGEERWNRIERVTVRVSNPSSKARVARLAFAKTGIVFLIPGILSTLSDASLNPIGLPVQVSKNWDSNPKWYRAITQMTVPAYTTWTLVQTTINAYWGGAAAVSYGQLALTYQPNAQWDQAAIGSWGETFCYEPDQSRSIRTAILDLRPVYVLGNGYAREKWGWATNVGGADVNYIDQGGLRKFNVQMKTHRKRTGPLLAETSYAGKSQDGKTSLQYTVAIERTDDAARATYHIRIDVKSNIMFYRFPIWSMSTETYSFGYNTRFSYGDENGLILDWPATMGPDSSGRDTYRSPFFELKGKRNWVSYTGADATKGSGVTQSQRMFVISQWNAVFNGRASRAFMAERGIHSYATTAEGGRVSIIEIVPPPGTTGLRAGDYVDCVVEQILLPQFSTDYYGPNTNFAAALERPGWEDTWRMALREAQVNNLGVVVTAGTLLRARPVMIRVDRFNRAQFTITGGLSYVAITLAGVTGFRDPKLEVSEDGTGNMWSVVDQSVWGKDFWQTDYDAPSSTWEITFSVKFDAPRDTRATRAYRFQLAGTVADLFGVTTWNANPLPWPTLAYVGGAISATTKGAQAAPPPPPVLADVTVFSGPLAVTGLAIGQDTSSSGGAFTVRVASGQSVVISAPATFAYRATILCNFAGWSNFGARTQTIKVDARLFNRFFAYYTIATPTGSQYGALPSDFTLADVGLTTYPNMLPSGAFVDYRKNLFFTAGGIGVSGTVDQHAFVYKNLHDVTGFEAVVKVYAVQYSIYSAQFGLAVRQSLSPRSAIAYWGITPKRYLTYQYRADYAERANINYISNDDAAVPSWPVWLKMRYSNSGGLQLQISSDGSSWRTVRSSPAPFQLTGTVFVGVLGSVGTPQRMTMLSASDLSIQVRS